jgi:hypothetical protein
LPTPNEDHIAARRSPRTPGRAQSWGLGVAILAGALLVAASCGEGDDAGGDVELCTNTCVWAHDGDCDDGGPGSDFSLCELGTDCGDCGPRRVSGSSAGTGCCCDPNTGVCTELVLGNVNDWESACGHDTPGNYSPGTCPTLDFRCMDANATNERTGESIVVHISFPSSICNYDGRMINTAGTCTSLGGCCEGTHCPGPDGTVPECRSCP